jgi:hypothetical protein
MSKPTTRPAKSPSGRSSSVVDSPLDFCRAKLAELRAVRDAADGQTWHAQGKPEIARLLQVGMVAFPLLLDAWEAELGHHEVDGANERDDGLVCRCGADWIDGCRAPAVMALARALGWRDE